MNLLSTLRVLRKYGSSGFAATLDDAIKLSRRQLDETLATMTGLHATAATATPAPSVVAGKN